MKSKYFLYDLDTYSDSARLSLEKELQGLGFEKITPGLGAGPSTEQIVAWLTIISRDLVIGVVSNMIASKLEKTLKQLFNWQKENKPSKTKKTPAVIVNIFFEKHSKIKSMTFRLDENNSKEQIVCKSKNVKSVEVIQTGRK